MKNFSALVAASVFAVGTLAAHATPLTLTPNGTTVALTSANTVTPVNTGTVSSTGVQTVTTATYSASVSEIVFHDSANVDCANCLDYEFTFTNIGPGTQGAPGDALLSSATGNSTLLGFLNFGAAAGYVAGTGVAPGTVNFSTVGTVTFDGFGGGVAAGQSSDALVIETNSMADRAGFITVSDSLSANFAGYIPLASATTTTPEPSSLVLLGTGILGLAGAARRKLSK